MSSVNITGGVTEGGRAGESIATIKSDTVALGRTSRGVHINTSGNLVGILVDDSATLTFAVIAGAEHHYRFKQIYSTGTTCTGVVIY